MEKPKAFSQYWDSYTQNVLDKAAQTMDLPQNVRTLIAGVARTAFYAGGFAAVIITLESANADDQSQFDELLKTVKNEGTGDIH